MKLKSIEKEGRHVFNVATFNLRGLAKRGKKQQLVRDIEKYQVDAFCLQETKIKKDKDQLQRIKGATLITLECSNQWHGNGFLISKTWTPHIHKYWRVTDRISVLQLKHGGDKNENTHIISIINIYAPTTVKAKTNPHELIQIYREIEKLRTEFKKIKTQLTIIAGDFNAKIGKRNKFR